MATDTIHNILAHGYYFLPSSDSIVVRGKEILDEVTQSRLSRDTIISIDSFAKFQFPGKEEIILSGRQIIELLPLTNYHPFIGYGACGLGIVLGWNLYFINRYRDRTKIVLADLASVMTAITGAALIAFLDHSQRSLGHYGVGLCIGFLLYFIMLVTFSIFSKNPKFKFPDYFLDPPDGQNPTVMLDDLSDRNEPK